MPPSSKRLEQADYTNAPEQINAEQQALAFLGRFLKDPDTARVEFHPVRRGWLREPLMSGRKTHFGWVLAAEVNARNSFGGYTGYQRYAFMYHDGELSVVFGPVTGQSGTFFSRIF